MKLDGKFYSFFETIYNFFLLNFVWLIMCLPIITIFPATTAMFGVIRQWKNNNDPGVFRPFFQFFKKNLKQSLLIELLSLIAIFLLLIDFTFIKQIGSPYNLILGPIFILLAVGVLLTFAFIFPVLVQYQVNWKEAIKNSFLLSISNLSLTVSSLFVIVVIGVVLWVFPFSFLFIFSIGAYVIYSFCFRAFRRVELLKEG